MKKVIVLEQAKADFAEGMDFYEKRDLGAGSYFAVRVNEALHDVMQHPGIHPQRYGLFCVLVPKFHHGILYRDYTDRVEVIAVLDLRRDPKRIRRQLRNR